MTDADLRAACHALVRQWEEYAQEDDVDRFTAVTERDWDTSAIARGSASAHRSDAKQLAKVLAACLAGAPPQEKEEKAEEDHARVGKSDGERR